MSAETERAQAIASGTQLLLGKTAQRGVTALLDAGWVPPAQRNEELRQTAEWQRDARRAFEAIEAEAHKLIDHGDWTHATSGGLILEALGERFTTPPKATS